MAYGRFEPLGGWGYAHTSERASSAPRAVDEIVARQERLRTATEAAVAPAAGAVITAEAAGALYFADPAVMEASAMQAAGAETTEIAQG